MEGKPPGDDVHDGDWDDLVRRYAPLVFSVIRRFGFDEASNEDLFQKVWLVALRKLEPAGKTHAAIRRFLVSAGFWVCRDHIKRGRRQRETAFEEEIRIASIDPAPHEVVEVHERVAEFRGCFEKLHPEDQFLLTCLFLDTYPWTYAEIAEQLGIPPEQVGPRRVRALEFLRKCMRKKGFEL